MIDRTQGSPSDEGHAELPPLRTLRDHPGLAASLRLVALHQETATLLELRAGRVATDEQAALLRRRAEQHRTLAQRLRRELAAVHRGPQTTAPSASEVQ